ncbi:hypothetical protein H9L19_06440 [Weissella diestrammenae]|uniref:Uncharacterized protein n=1 Tax=Weissella diestrammenae TaxID=1162633 RepID=A0A7G9T4J4_9LACO|nr:hypothetical protein H9L19_06440 [Weissella diestrammenae]
MTSEKLSDGKICASCLSKLGLTPGTVGNSTLLKDISVSKAQSLIQGNIKLKQTNASKIPRVATDDINPTPTSNIPVPDEIKGWNWGAFAFSWLWGIANKTYLPLLTLVPIFNIVWIFVVGAKGNEWAWQDGDTKDIATFKAIQDTWNRAGIAKLILVVFGIVVYILFLASFISAITSYYTYGY